MTKKRILILAGVAVGVLVVAAVAVTLLVDVEQYRPTVEKEISAALGREVRIGKLELALLRGGVAAADIRIADDPRFSPEPFVEARSLSLGVNLISLLFGSLHVSSLTLEEPHIRLLRTPAGEWNFSTLAAGDKKNTASTGSADISISTLAVRNGRVSVGSVAAGRTPRALGKPYVYENVNLTAHNISTRSRMPFTFDASTPGGGSLRAQGAFGPLDSGNAAHSPLEAEFTVKSMDLAGSGFIDPKSGLAGVLDLDGKLRSDGKAATLEGTARAQGLRLVAGGSPARTPVALGYNATYDVRSQAGNLTRGEIRAGAARAALGGSYNAKGDSVVLRMKFKGDAMPVGEVQGLLPAFGVVLPPGSSLQGGTVSANLSIDGPLDQLVITGPINLSNARLAGFDLGARMQAISALAGVQAGRDTHIESLASRLRVAPEGIRADDLSLVLPALGSLTGAGTIGANNSLNFKMQARLAGGGGVLGGMSALSTLGQSKGAIPFLIQGTTSNPVFVPDVAGAVTGTAKAPVEAVTGIKGLFRRKKEE
jgi:AsmA protein